MTVGKCLSAITCILGVITFILLAVYGSKGGIVQTTVYVALAAAIICEAAALLGEKIFTDFTGIVASAALAFVTMQVFSDGIWNIAEAMSGIRMVGLPELAGTNYLLAALGVVSIITSVVANFLKSNREHLGAAVHPGCCPTMLLVSSQNFDVNEQHRKS